MEGSAGTTASRREATMRADRLLTEGDTTGAAVWKRIVKAVEALLAKERPAGTKPN